MVHQLHGHGGILKGVVVAILAEQGGGGRREGAKPVGKEQ